MSIAEKLTTIAENEQKVYDAGAKSEYDKFWDALQENGQRTNYTRAFQYWGAEYISPKYVIAPTSNNSTYLFSYCKNLKNIDVSKFNYSGVPVNYEVSTSGPVYALFNQCSSLEYLSDIQIPSTVSYGYFCYNCANLVTVEIWRVSKESKFDGTFYGCESLENITVEGQIGQNKLSFVVSTRLTHDSLMSIINALYDYTAEGSTETHTLSLGTTNLEKLTDEEKAIATQKGWTLA